MSTADDEATLDRTVRHGLGLVTDVLLPGTDQLPSGRSVGCHEQLLDRVLAVDPTLSPVVERVGRRAGDAVSCTLDDLVAWAEGDVEQLVHALNLAYYMAPDVLEALRYPGQVRRPIGEAGPDERVDEELLAPVRAMGAIYVPTPDA